jgi:hypothetical protein
VLHRPHCHPLPLSLSSVVVVWCFRGGDTSNALSFPAGDVAMTMASSLWLSVHVQSVVGCEVGDSPGDNAMVLLLLFPAGDVAATTASSSWLSVRVQSVVGREVGDSLGDDTRVLSLSFLLVMWLQQRRCRHGCLCVRSQQLAVRWGTHQAMTQWHCCCCFLLVTWL